LFHLQMLHDSKVEQQPRPFGEKQFSCRMQIDTTFTNNLQILNLLKKLVGEK
jgi:hypothetical protein